MLFTTQKIQTMAIALVGLLNFSALAYETQEGPDGSRIKIPPTSIRNRSATNEFINDCKNLDYNSGQWINYICGDGEKKRITLWLGDGSDGMNDDGTSQVELKGAFGFDQVYGTAQYKNEYMCIAHRAAKTLNVDLKNYQEEVIINPETRIAEKCIREKDRPSTIYSE
jgi:hypothetical protein